MYALFENGKFKEFVSEVAAWTYQADLKYMLYKIDMKQIKEYTKIDEYDCILDKDSTPVLIPKIWCSLADLIRREDKVAAVYINNINVIKDRIINHSFIKRLKYLFTRKLEV